MTMTEEQAKGKVRRPSYLPKRELKLSHEDENLRTPAWWDGRYYRNRSGRIHRQIACRMFGEIPTGKYVDHKNGDTGDNRRENLRLCTPQENVANKAAASKGKSKFHGVFPHRRRWAAQIQKGSLRLHLGTFDTEVEAALAYNGAAIKIHGEFARLNDCGLTTKT